MIMSMDMFEFIFGWRKASQCKKLIRKAHCRLNLLKNKRCCIIGQLRKDVAQLIKLGHHQPAFNRVDQIYKDECIVAVYNLLALFCEFLSLQLSYIRRNKDCPKDINEAISTLIFASARCGDVPELLHIRKLFRDRYGEQFEAKALELHPENLVNLEIRDKLSIKTVPNEVKYKLMEEITTTSLQTGPLALEFYSELHQQETKSNVNQAIEFTSEQHQQAIQNNAIQALEFSCKQEQESKSNANQAVQGTGNEQFSHVDFDHTAGENDRSITDRVAAESSSDNPSTDVPKDIVYLDDIEEFQSPTKYGGNGKDQRVFVFTSSAIVPVVEIRKHRRFIDFDIEKTEGLRIETKRSSKSRKRSVASVMECSRYYDNTHHRRRASHHDKKISGSRSHISTPLSGNENLFAKQIEEAGVISRAITMPPKRSTKCLDEKDVVRSYSLPVQPSSPHVHPKLPDYDELAAKFMALKKENLQKEK